MKTNQIEKGKQYEITIGKNKTTVKVLSVDTRVNGQTAFDCMNVKTNKRLSVTDPKRFLREIKDEKPTVEKTAKTKPEKPTVETKPGDKMSGINAAYKILVEEARPMKVKEITELAMQRGYCDLPGATPSATISSAIQREIKTKQETSRFVKTDKGLFAAR